MIEARVLSDGNVQIVVSDSGYITGTAHTMTYDEFRRMAVAVATEIGSRDVPPQPKRSSPECQDCGYFHSGSCERAFDASMQAMYGDDW